MSNKIYGTSTTTPLSKEKINQMIDKKIQIAKNELIGTADDEAWVDTIKGAKQHSLDLMHSLEDRANQTFVAKTQLDEAVEELKEYVDESIKSIASWADVQKIVRSGLASRMFSVGEQLACERNGEMLVWDIIGIDHDIPVDKTKTHSMTLQLHNVFTKIQGCNVQAMFYAENGLSAGTYNFSIPAGIDDEYGGGKTYSFTLTKPVPVGGVVYYPWGHRKQATEVKVYTYPNNTDSHIEYANVREGAEGTSLESLGELNHFDRRYGSNNWFNSATRQYINSPSEAGSVWTPKDKYDRPPSWKNDTEGFLNGMDEDFLAVIGEVEKATALSDIDGGGIVTESERFFLLSSTEVYGYDETATPEGKVYSYYKDLSDNNKPTSQADSNRVKYLLSDTSATSEWLLRTPQVSLGNYIRVVTNGDGKVGRQIPQWQWGVCPACCIV